MSLAGHLQRMPEWSRPPLERLLRGHLAVLWDGSPFAARVTLFVPPSRQSSIATIAAVVMKADHRDSFRALPEKGVRGARLDPARDGRQS